ncbi:unnamed protein product [Merluccius merluccius]
MGKETMVTFSHTLPRAGMTVPGAEESFQHAERHLKPVQVPTDPMHSQELVSAWQQKLMETKREEESPSDEGSEVGSVGPDEGTFHIPIYPPPGARVTVSPKPHFPEAGPPAVSPKSTLTRAKWLAIREKSSPQSPSSQPRLLQVISMSKQQGLLPSSSSSGETPKSSETSSSGMSSTANSPHYVPPSKHHLDRASILTVDAHAPHYPVVHGPSNSGNPWEWRSLANGRDQRDAYELKNHGHRQQRTALVLLDREVPNQLLVLLDREVPNQPKQQNYYKNMHG